MQVARKRSTPILNICKLPEYRKENDMHEALLCPICGHEYLYMDKCPNGWTYCLNGHAWRVRYKSVKFVPFRDAQRRAHGHLTEIREIRLDHKAPAWNVDITEVLNFGVID